MNEMSDQKLDDLFRKSAEEIEIPFDPEAWQRMEQKLDDDGHRNGWLRWGFLAGLLLLVGTGIYLFQQRQGGLALPKDTILASGNAKAKTTGNRVVKSSVTKPNDAQDNALRQGGGSGNKDSGSNAFFPGGQASGNGENTVGMMDNDRKAKPVTGGRNSTNAPANQTKAIPLPP